MNLFFLAAGLGTRLKPLTLTYPKPSVPFLNVPMGLYQFRFTNNLNITSCAINTHHLPEKIKNIYENNCFYKNNLNFSHENTILGTGGALKKASPYFNDDETILMMNADEIFFTENTNFLNEAYQQHIKNNNLATLVVTNHPKAGQQFGAIWSDAKSNVKTIMPAGQKPTENLTAKHYIGIIFLNKRILNLIPENTETNIFYDILIHELKNNSVQTYNLDCSWYETGNPVDYFIAIEAVLKSINQKTLDFINTYDNGRLIKNETGISLVSNEIKVNENKLRGYNVISKTANKNLIENLNVIENSVLFNDVHLNKTYFKLE